MKESQNYEVSITVFTPTYNRAYVLKNLFNSLKRQTLFNFEWLIVDDGSIDTTEDEVAMWCTETLPFPIRYYKKENGGKHRAINFALQKARGKMFFVVDSDDYLTDTAMEKIVGFLDSLPAEGETKYAGVAGCRGYYNGEMIGTSFKGEYIDCFSINREQYGISGDKAEVFFTSIMKEYPFPEYPREKFVTEAAVWDKMSLDGYSIRYYNEIIYLCEYLEDGLTKQGLELYYKNPKGYGYYLRQARQAGKFEKSVQLYHDVECYLHWRDSMKIKEIAELIGTNSILLIYKVFKYQLRQYGSKYKHFLIEFLKKRT